MPFFLHDLASDCDSEIIWLDQLVGFVSVWGFQMVEQKYSNTFVPRACTASCRLVENIFLFCLRKKTEKVNIDDLCGGFRGVKRLDLPSATMACRKGRLNNNNTNVHF